MKRLRLCQSLLASALILVGCGGGGPSGDGGSTGLQANILLNGTPAGTLFLGVDSNGFNVSDRSPSISVPLCPSGSITISRSVDNSVHSIQDTVSLRFDFLTHFDFSAPSTLFLGGTNAVTANGLGTVGALITLTTNGTVVGSTTVNNTGHWS